MSINSFEIICYKMQIFNNFIKINIYYFMKCRVSDQTSYASAIGAINILVQFKDGDCDTQGIKKIIYIVFYLHVIN